MFEPLQSVLDRPWKPVSRPALVGWLIFYLWFLVYAYHAHGGGLFIDMANLVVHEGGHNLFGWFGPTLGLWGGTLLQWMVPFLLAVYFFKERESTGFVFCTFIFFENWLYTATYMADARTQELPLVTTGDPEFVEHDWFRIFSSMGVLNYDTKIAAVVRLLGWLGMIAAVVWLASRWWVRTPVQDAVPSIIIPKSVSDKTVIPDAVVAKMLAIKMGVPINATESSKLSLGRAAGPSVSPRKPPTSENGSGSPRPATASPQPKVPPRRPV
jgi:hypothetical protein